MTPYIKGIHLTLDSWQTGQAKSGWKEEVANQKWRDKEDDPDGCDLTNTLDERLFLMELWMRDRLTKPPTFVYAVPRLHWDIDSLSQLTSGKTPPAVLV
jgi:hypothetical protein